METRFSELPKMTMGFGTSGDDVWIWRVNTMWDDDLRGWHVGMQCHSTMKYYDVNTQYVTIQCNMVLSCIISYYHIIPYHITTLQHTSPHKSSTWCVCHTMCWVVKCWWHQMSKVEKHFAKWNENTMNDVGEVKWAIGNDEETTWSETLWFSLSTGHHRQCEWKWWWRIWLRSAVHILTSQPKHGNTMVMMENN